jgi:DNA recombination protein RmuC
MSAETFLIALVAAILVAGTVGAVIAALVLRAREAGRAAEAALDSTKPIADTLARIETHMREIDAQRERMAGGLGQQLSELTRETVALSRALRVPNARGRWGELTLKRVAELAGMAAYCDFYEQETGTQGSNGRQRPDMVVRLPGGRMLAVDAKVPLAAYLDAEAATDPAARDAALARHAQQVARHVATLSAREYWSQFQPAPEMVVLFLAGDHFLAAALEREPDLLERALARKVMIATPVTLISVLKGVAYGWRQERLAQNAEELRRIGAEFYERLRGFAENYAESGRALAKALEVYNRSAGSWDTRVLPSLRRMNELGVGGSGEPPLVQPLDGAAREPKPLPASGGDGRASGPENPKASAPPPAPVSVQPRL